MTSAELETLCAELAAVRNLIGELRREREILRLRQVCDGATFRLLLEAFVAAMPLDQVAKAAGAFGELSESLLDQVRTETGEVLLPLSAALRAQEARLLARMNARSDT